MSAELRCQRKIILFTPETDEDTLSCLPGSGSNSYHDEDTLSYSILILSAK